jgi:pro-apoptotic serine protease NMA111
MVRKVDSGPDSGLQEGDIILTLNGRLITRVTDLDIMYSHDMLDAVIVRKREEVHLRVPTVHTQEFETDHAVVFCGAILHRPHHAVRQQISRIHSDIYVSARMRGSPAYQYGLAPTNFITGVNGVPVRTLPDFLAETNRIPDNTYFRLKVVTFDNVKWVVTMKKCEHYFPTVEFIKDESERCHWRRVTYEGGVGKEGEGKEGAISMVGGQVEIGGSAGDEVGDED